MTIMRGGYASQGTPVGILTADTVTPRIIGDAGNAFSFEFPVRYGVVRELNTFDRTAPDAAVREAVVVAAKELVEKGGCLMIAAASSCFAAYQQDIAKATGVPVLTDTLVTASFTGIILQPDKKIAILTTDSRKLSAEDCAGFGLDAERVIVCGMEDSPAFVSAFSGTEAAYDYETVRDAILSRVKTLCLGHPEIGAIICENCAFSPFAPEINKLVCKPVFDPVNIINWAASGVLRGMTSPFKSRLDGGTTAVPPSWGRRPEHLREED